MNQRRSSGGAGKHDEKERRGYEDLQQKVKQAEDAARLAGEAAGEESSAEDAAGRWRVHRRWRVHEWGWVLWGENREDG